MTSGRGCLCPRLTRPKAYTYHLALCVFFPSILFCFAYTLPTSMIDIRSENLFHSIRSWFGMSKATSRLHKGFLGIDPFCLDSHSSVGHIHSTKGGKRKKNLYPPMIMTRLRQQRPELESFFVCFLFGLSSFRLWNGMGRVGLYGNRRFCLSCIFVWKHLD